MALAAPTLRATFDRARVTRIAIVDDGYDPPVTGDLSEAGWAAFRAAVDEADALGEHTQVLGADGDLPAFGDLRNPLAAALWEHSLTAAVADPRAVGADPVADALEALYRPFAGRKTAKRRELGFVEAIAQEATGVAPDRLPSTTQAADLVGYDLVFLDFFLGEETRDGVEATDLLEAARAQARRIVRETIDAPGAGSMPLFVLISSRADPDSVPTFRDEAEMLASKFRFLSKGEIEADRVKAEYELTGLVMERDAGDAVEKLLKEWKASIHGAVGDMMTSVRRLDVTDYAYLQRYRLAEEKVSLLEYLTWLFNAYLGSFVESRLARSDDALVAPIKAAAVPPAVLQPMSEIPRIYSAVTTTQVQSFADAAPVTIATGDLFVRRELLQPANDSGDAAAVAADADAEPAAAADDAAAAPINAPDAAPAGPQPETAPAAQPDVLAAVEQPDILAAVTPICDLIPGREKAKSVLLIGGTMSAPGKAKAASNHLISVTRPGSPPGEPPRSFQIDWEKKWPVSHPRAAFDGAGILGTDYVRIGRLRELYAADLAQELSGDLARVGLPIAPPFTHPLHARVLARVGRKVIRLFESDATEPLAWELYAKKTGEKREAMLATDMIWKLRAAATEKVADDGAECRTILCNPEILRPLTTAFALKDKATPTTAGAKLLVLREAAPPAKDAIQDKATMVVIHLSGSYPEDH